MKLKRIALGCSVVLVLVAAALTALALSPAGRQVTDAVVHVVETDELQGKPLENGAQVLDYLIAHPERVSLAMWRVGDPDGGIFHDADSPHPLASTMKIVPVAIASQKLARGDWDAGVLLDDVGTRYLPKTDGDAHPQAEKTLGPSQTWTLGQTLTAMIRFSDNAAADALLFRIGRDELTTEAVKLGVSPLHPLTGEQLLAATRAPDTSDDAAWAIAQRLHDDGAWRTSLRPGFERGGIELSMAEQEKVLPQLDNRGTARSYALLMETLFTADAGYETARQQLSWPMEFESNQKKFVVLATKGGSIPGVLTSAIYAEDKRGRRHVLAMFLHELPFATWLQLSRSFAHQDLEQALLLDDATVEKVRRAFGDVAQKSPSDAGP